MMPLSSLRIVLFPAPLAPITPNAWPRGTWKDTSRTAQNSRASSPPSREAPRPSSRRAAAGIRSRSESYTSPFLNFL